MARFAHAVADEAGAIVLDGRHSLGISENRGFS